MTLYALMILLITLMASLSFAPNPLVMGLMVLLSALTLSLLFSLSMSSWYAFLIFLIYVGGMLVMFSYFVALAPNQQTMSSNWPWATLAIISFLIPFKPISTPPTILLAHPQLDLLYKASNSPVLIILGLLLLFTMIVVVKVSSLSKGPLRAFS